MMGEHQEKGKSLLPAIECLLFMAESPVSSHELSQILEIPPEEVDGLIGILQQEYANRGLQIVTVAGGYQMCTRPEYADLVAKLFPPPKFRLSRPALETLAIIAYKQPITRPEIEALRGVNSDAVVGTLIERGLIRPCGRKKAPGRPVLYATTDDFLSHFGLGGLSDLPELPGDLQEPEREEQ